MESKAELLVNHRILKLKEELENEIMELERRIDRETKIYRKLGVSEDDIEVLTHADKSRIRELNKHFEEQKKQILLRLDKLSGQEA